MRILHEGRSEVGRRSNNEDGLLALPEHGLFAVADGMGGYEGGEVASRVALASLQSYFELLGDGGLGIATDERAAEERMALAIRIADREVERRAVDDLAEMGTTLATLAIEGGLALIAHVGDSRVYRLRDGELTALTRDHSLFSQMEQAGVSWLPRRKAGFPLSNVITQALGPNASARPDLRVEEVVVGDRFLLCTDGLSDVLDDSDLTWLLSRSEGTAEALVKAAFDAGSGDNITALVLRVENGA